MCSKRVESSWKMGERKDKEKRSYCMIEISTGTMSKILELAIMLDLHISNYKNI